MKQFRFVCVIVILLVLPFVVRAQSSDSIRSIYIKSYPDKFFLWPVLKNRTLSFKLEDPTPGGKNAEFIPNNAVGLGLGVYLFDIGLEFVFAMPQKEIDKTRLGKTSATDLQLNILSKRWGADIFYQSYKGFYLSNPETPVPFLAPYPQRPDVTTENYGISGAYVLSPQRFSLRSSFTFADRQLKSKGSFVIAGTINSFRIKGDSAILNPTYVKLLHQNNAFDQLDYRTFSMAPGYAHNFILKHFFFSFLLAVGPAVQEFHYTDINDIGHSNTKVNAFADGRLAIGYSNDKFFCGITFTNQIRNVVFENVRFSSSSQTSRLLFGWRFTESGFLKNSVWDLLPPWGKKKSD